MGASMTVYYKAVRPDGTDFRTGSVRWLPPVPTKTGVFRNRVVVHPTSQEVVPGDHRTSLAASDDVMVLPGARWPMRLAEVAPAEGYPAPVRCTCGCSSKYQALAWRVLREAPAHLRYGPQGEHVVALLEALQDMTAEQAWEASAAWRPRRRSARYAAWASAWSAAESAAQSVAQSVARSAARSAAWEASWSLPSTWSAAWSGAWSAAQCAAAALVVRDLISSEHYDTLTFPLRVAGVVVHPDDPEVGEP